MRLITLLLALLLTKSAFGAEPIAILPSATDARIAQFDAPHLAWLPDGTPRNQLLLFLPGTGSVPEKPLFHAFAATAASLGYHVVVLMYPDNIASQKTCSQSEDPDCYLPLICIDPSRVQRIIRHFVVQCVGSRTDSIPTVDQSDIRGLVTA
jgi:hypothetical protein